MAPRHPPGMRRCRRRALQIWEGRPQTAGPLRVFREGHGSLWGWQRTGTQPCGSQGSWWPPRGLETTAQSAAGSRENCLAASPNPRPAPAQPRRPWEPEARGGPHPCGWLAPGCPCGLQEGLRAHLRPISQSHTQMSPLVALGKHSANHRATKRAASHGFKCICSSPWPGAHTLLPARPSPPSRGQVVRITNTPRPLPGPLGLSVSPNLL